MFRDSSSLSNSNPSDGDNTVGRNATRHVFRVYVMYVCVCVEFGIFMFLTKRNEGTNERNA